MNTRFCVSGFKGDQEMDKRFFNTKEAAEIMGYSEEVIRQLVRAGKIKVYRHSKRSNYRFLFSDLKAFLAGKNSNKKKADQPKKESD